MRWVKRFVGNSDKLSFSPQNSLFVVEGDIRKVFPSGPVDGILESWMVRVQLMAVGQDLVGKVIQLLDVNRIPRSSACN